jgi:hypothetical protein
MGADHGSLPGVRGCESAVGAGGGAGLRCDRLGADETATAMNIVAGAGPEDLAAIYLEAAVTAHSNLKRGLIGRLA